LVFGRREQHDRRPLRRSVVQHGYYGRGIAFPAAPFAGRLWRHAAGKTNAAWRRNCPRRERRGKTRGASAGYGGRASPPLARGGKKSGRPRKARLPAGLAKARLMAGLTFIAMNAAATRKI
jgi:hypothetical protein